MADRCQFDNIDDIQSKFLGTIIYYDGIPMYVRDAGHIKSKEDPSIWTYVLFASDLNGVVIDIDLNNDPKFSYRDYVIGYANSGEVAIWWFRHAVRQWRQGLRRDQLGYSSHYDGFVFDDFNLNSSTVKMLRNIYPTVLSAEQLLRTEKRKIVAFHKDFALQHEPIRNDFTLEYRGKPIGFTKNLKDFNLVDDYSYLTESLAEAIADNNSV